MGETIAGKQDVLNLIIEGPPRDTEIAKKITFCHIVPHFSINTASYLSFILYA